MKSSRKSIKKTIKKRIELNMGVRDRFMITPKRPRPINVGRNQVRTGLKGINGSNYVPYEVKDYGIYIKPESVDYDVMIYISSYDRYEKLLNILEQLHSQETEYSFKVIVMDDGSTDERYINLGNKFPNITLLKNGENGGKEFYLKTINTIFSEIKKYTTYCVIQIDDDFILCDGFINKLISKFFQLKEENNACMGIRYHHFSYLDGKVYGDEHFDDTKRFQGFDGGSLFDIQFLELFDYTLVPTEEEFMWHMWFVLNNLVKDFGVMIRVLRKSLALHTGNDDSKMHSESRKTKKIYTTNFIDD